MPHVDAIKSTRAFHRTMPDWENDAFALPERHDFDARLHAGTLLGQYEFAAVEIGAWVGEQEGDLERKNVVAVNILVQAVVIARTIL